MNNPLLQQLKLNFQELLGFEKDNSLDRSTIKSSIIEQLHKNIKKIGRDGNSKTLQIVGKVIDDSNFLFSSIFLTSVPSLNLIYKNVADIQTINESINNLLFSGLIMQSNPTNNAQQAFLLAKNTSPAEKKELISSANEEAFAKAFLYAHKQLTTLSMFIPLQHAIVANNKGEEWASGASFDSLITMEYDFVTLLASALSRSDKKVPFITIIREKAYNMFFDNYKYYKASAAILSTASVSAVALTTEYGLYTTSAIALISGGALCAAAVGSSCMIANAIYWYCSSDKWKEFTDFCQNFEQKTSQETTTVKPTIKGALEHSTSTRSHSETYLQQEKLQNSVTL